MLPLRQSLAGAWSGPIPKELIDLELMDHFRGWTWDDVDALPVGRRQLAWDYVVEKSKAKSRSIENARSGRRTSVTPKRRKTIAQLKMEGPHHG